MALKKTGNMDISSQITSLHQMSETSVPETSGEQSSLKEIPDQMYVPSAEYGQKVTKPKKTSGDNSALVGFKLPKEAKEQYRNFFEGYGLNLSEAVKNALEYFVADIQKGKVKITLTRHFERVEE